MALERSAAKPAGQGRGIFGKALPQGIIRESGTQNLGQTQHRAVCRGYGHERRGDVVERGKSCWLVGGGRVYQTYCGSLESDNESDG